MKPPTDFLIVVSHDGLKQQFAGACAALGLTCDVAPSFEEALNRVDAGRYQFIFVDLEDAALRSLQFLEWIKTRAIVSKIGVLYTKSYSREVMQAIALGATEQICVEGLEADWLRQRLGFFVEWNRTQGQLESVEFEDPHKEHGAWIGGDPRMRRILEKADALSLYPLPVLISGERGTGKSCLAHYVARLHTSLKFDVALIAEYEQKNTILKPLGEALNNSKFVPGTGADLSLIVENIESLHEEIQEVFADYFKTGVFETGLGDDIQSSLDRRPRIQLVTTTSADLDSLADEDLFRQDLFLLLEKNQMVLPPLRDRVEDISLLADYFLQTLPGSEKGCCFARDAMTALTNYEWLQNVRELKEIIGSLLSGASDRMISSKALPASILQQSFYKGIEEDRDLSDFSYLEAKKRVLNKFNHDYIVELLRKSDNNLTVAAEKAGMDRSNFKKIIKKYGLMR